HPDPATGRYGLYLAFLDRNTANMGELGEELAHEIGHYLGLPHAYIPDGWAGETFYCASNSYSVEVYDYHRTNYIGPPVPCGTGNPNNLMNADAGCNKNLSPGQMAVMRYNLCTRFASCLTPTAYAVA